MGAEYIRTYVPNNAHKGRADINTRSERERTMSNQDTYTRAELREAFKTMTDRLSDVISDSYNDCNTSRAYEHELIEIWIDALKGELKL